MPETKSQADLLYAQLEDYKNEYKTSILDEANQEKIKSAGDLFHTNCTTAIKQAMPVLEKDLGWGDYLKNLLKTLVQAIVKVISFGYKDVFFAHKKSTASTIAQITEQELKMKGDF